MGLHGNRHLKIRLTAPPGWRSQNNAASGLSGPSVSQSLVGPQQAGTSEQGRASPSRPDWRPGIAARPSHGPESTGRSPAPPHNRLPPPVPRPWDPWMT